MQSKIKSGTEKEVGDLSGYVVSHYNTEENSLKTTCLPVLRSTRWMQD